MPLYFHDPDGVQVDMSSFGTDWRAQLRPKPDSADITDFSIDLSKMAQGKVMMQLSSADTGTLSSSGFWDLQIQQTGVVATMFYGTYQVQKDVTKPDGP